MVKKVFSLNEEHIAIINHYVNYLNFNSEVGFIRYLIENFHKSKDPENQIKEITATKIRLNEEIKNLEIREKELETLKKLNDLNTEGKEIKLKKALELISGMINKNYSESKWRSCAIYWAKEIPFNIDRLITLAQLKAHGKI